MKNIALALSGGGFRAAAFSLGTLSYLNELKFEGKPLIQNIKFIGSTSGGSFTNIAYSLGIYQGKSFPTVYKEVLIALDGEKLIARVFAILKDPKVWENRGKKSRNLINAFSIAYDEVYGHAEFNALFDPEGVDPDLPEVCINSTEFSNGLSFRFQSQKAGKVNGKIGNYYIYFTNTDIGGQMLLGDLMACSSCFSGGFEPFIFPDDFVHDQLNRDTLSDNVSFTPNPFTIPGTSGELLSDNDFHEIKNRFGLMDGGVDDNQAIDSIYKANDRRATDDKFDLVILTDVTSYLMDGYTLPLEKKTLWNSFTLQQLINVLKLLGLGFLAILIYVLLERWHNWMRFAFIPLGVIGLAYLFGVIKLAGARKDAAKEKSTWLIVLFKYVNYFLTIRYSQIEQMLASRLKSVLMLADDVYLKTIRRMYYDKIYKDPILSGLTVSNAIYDLSKVKQKALDNAALKTGARYGDLTDAGHEDLTDPVMLAIPDPAKGLIDVAEQARLMPTTLWFDPFQKEDKTLRAIVATGQFTICYNLLKYLVKLEQTQPLSPSLSGLKNDLLADWKAFNENPYVLYDKIQPTT